jgi:hypothetical protein
LQAFQNTEKQKAAELNAFQEKIKALEAEKVEKEKLLNEFQAKAEQEKKDIRWNAFQSKIPVGWKTADKVAATRKEFEDSPHAFMDKLMGFQMGTQPGKTDGDENAGAGGAAKKAVSVGKWDYIKKEFVQ